jgi:hypothetical protein
MSQSIKQHAANEPLHPRSTPVVVRVGQQTWTVGETGGPLSDETLPNASASTSSRRHVTQSWRSRLQSRFPNMSGQLSNVEAAAVRLLQTDGQAGRPSQTPNTPYPSNHIAHRHRLRESFQVGLIAGLILGCLSIVMFHHVEPSTISQTEPTSAALPTGTGHISMPAFTLEAVVSGSSLSEAQATLIQDNLKKHNVTSALLVQPKGIDVVTGMALSTSDLASVLKRTKSVSGSVRVQIKTEHYVSVMIPAGAGLSQSDADRLSRWLSAVGSSLNTMIASSIDGANVRDAKASFESAKALEPDGALFQQSGYTNRFNALNQDWHNAYVALVKKQTEQANNQACKAIAQMFALCSHSVSS